MVSCLGDTILKKDDGNFKQEEDTSSNVLPTLFDKLLHRPKNNDPIRILVIGDSLGVGIGCLEVFDPKKNNSFSHLKLMNWCHFKFCFQLRLAALAVLTMIVPTI